MIAAIVLLLSMLVPVGIAVGVLFNERRALALSS